MIMDSKSANRTKIIQFIRLKIRNHFIINELRILYVLKVGIEPTLPKKLDFESSASTNSAT